MRKKSSQLSLRAFLQYTKQGSSGRFSGSVLRLRRQITGIKFAGAVVQKLTDADTARVLHRLHMLVDQLLDDKRLADVFQLQVRRALSEEWITIVPTPNRR